MRMFALVGVGVLVLAIGNTARADCPEPACFVGTTKMYVGFAPGGSADTAARFLAAKLQSQFGQSVVIENVSGAAGSLAAERTVRERQGWRVLLFSPTTVVTVNDKLYKLSWDPSKDLAPAALFAAAPQVLVVNTNVPAKTLSELLALAKQKPGSLAYASGGSGSLSHLAGEQLQAMAGVTLTHVPYRGAAPALQDAIGGQIQMMFVDVPSAVPFVQGGKLRALAVAGAKRSSLLPDVPTLDEAGIKGFESEVVFGIFLAAGTDSQIVSRVNTEVNKALGQADTREFLARNGLRSLGGSSQEVTRHLAVESARWTKVIREAAIKAE